MSSFIKQIKQFLIHYEAPIVYIIGLMLFAALVSRIKSGLQTTACADGRCLVVTAQSILNGISPYFEEIWRELGMIPLQSPSVSLIIMPVCFFSRVYQNLFFFFVPLLFYYAFVIMVFYYYGLHPKDYLKPRWSSIPIWIILVLVLSSSPLMLMLSAGQLSSITAAFLFAALLFPERDKSVNFLFLGLAAAIKYSLLTFQVPLLLLQKRFRLAITGFVLFAILVLSVGLWLDGIIPAFVEYVRMLLDDVQHGYNSYSKGGEPTFLYIGFFKFSILNFLFKAGIVAVYAFVLWKVYCRDKENKSSEYALHLSCAEWALFTVMTCLISYHRLHDGVIFMPFLGVLFLQQYKQNSSSDRIKSVLLLLFLLFWACPRKIILHIGEMIATNFPAGTKLVWYGSMKIEGGRLVSFPIYQCVILLMLILLSWIVFSDHQTKTADAAVHVSPSPSPAEGQKQS